MSQRVVTAGELYIHSYKSKLTYSEVQKSEGTNATCGILFHTKFFIANDIISNSFREKLNARTINMNFRGFLAFCTSPFCFSGQDKTHGHSQ